MIAVIQCASSKHEHGGHLRNEDGIPILFVADPSKAQSYDERIYAHPDNLSNTGVSWRDILIQYNASAGNNPLGLLAAYKLYKNSAYLRLVKDLGADRTYILSAGWGLIRADFLIPHYDITFSAAVKKNTPHKYRRKNDAYADLQHIPPSTHEPVVFFGGKDYVPLFCALTKDVKGERTVYYNSQKPPEAKGCTLVEFSTNRQTNWHYECVDAFLKGQLNLKPLNINM